MVVILIFGIGFICSSIAQDVYRNVFIYLFIYIYIYIYIIYIYIYTRATERRHVWDHVTSVAAICTAAGAGSIASL